MPAWAILPWLQQQYKRHLETGQQKSQQTARLSACFIELPGFSQDESCPGTGVSKVQKSNSSCEKRDLQTVRNSPCPVSWLSSGTGPKMPVQVFRLLSSTTGTNLALSAMPSQLAPEVPWPAAFPSCVQSICHSWASPDPGPQSLLQLLESNIGFLSITTGSFVSLPLSMAFISCHTATKNNSGYNLYIIYIIYIKNIIVVLVCWWSMYLWKIMMAITSN